MISIEFSHILGNEKINSYHEKSYSVFLELKEKLGNDNVQGCIFIDDYNFCYSRNKLPFNLSEKDCLIYKENDIQQYAPIVLKLLNLENNRTIKLKNVLLKNNGKFTCSLLTTCWYLYRLGYFNEEMKFSSIINILPKKFYNVEKNVLKVLKHVDRELPRKVKHIFLDNPEGDDEIHAK